MESLSALSAPVSALTTTARADGESTQPGFSTVFSSMLNSISQYQDQAAQQVKGIELGQSEVGVNDLMISVQKATVSLQLGVQVRNKMIAAYNDVMNMSV